MDKQIVGGTKARKQPLPSQMDNQGRVNQLLRLADEKVKVKSYEEALRLVRSVYSIDVKNMYARAYEERILTIKIDEERDRATKDVERRAEEKIESELKRRMNEFYKSMQMETIRKKQLESKEQSLEDHARQASVAEQQEIVQKGMVALEANMKNSIEELEKRLAFQVQRAVGMGGVLAPGSALSADQIRTQYETELARIKQQYEEAEAALRSIHQETFSKMAEENQHARDELVQRMDEQREELLQREKERTRQISLEAYKALLASMEELGVQQSLHEPLLQALRIPFSISEEEHHNIKRSVHLDLYISVLRGAWQKGRPTGEEVVNLKSLQTLYGLSDEEHFALTKSAKKDLGLPDDTAVILVVDDDPILQEFIRHILKRTYHTVLSAKTADDAIKTMQENLPALILCDLHLGSESISGVTLYEKLRQGVYGDPLKDVTFVLMSALRDEFFVKSANNLGIKTFLPKPFTKELLENTVKEALNWEPYREAWSWWIQNRIAKHLEHREGEIERWKRITSFLHPLELEIKAISNKRAKLVKESMSTFSHMIKRVKEFSAKYPAVLSGYIIYSYLFITLMHFFLKAKSRRLTVYDIYETFNALPFMWLLSSALVKIIDMKMKLHSSERERILNLRELEMKQTQLSTMHEVARGFQHKINNPLTIISLSLSGARRAVADNPAILERLSCIGESAKRIQQAVIDFSGAQKYDVEHVGNVVGSMASPVSLRPPADAGMSFQWVDASKTGSILSGRTRTLVAAWELRDLYSIYINYNIDRSTQWYPTRRTIPLQQVSKAPYETVWLIEVVHRVLYMIPQRSHEYETHLN